MFEWKSQIEPGKTYSMQIETDDEKKYRFMEKAAQNAIDDKYGWISVKDRLPENRERVLVFGKSKKPKSKMNTVAITSRGFINRWANPLSNTIGWFEPWQYFDAEWEITHWMPLPESPKEEK